MPLARYGVLKGRVSNRRRGVGRSRHYHVHVKDGDCDYRVAVNFKSKYYPSELLFLVDENFVHPVTSVLIGLAPGFNDLAPTPASGALDYIRGNLFSLNRVRAQTPGARDAAHELKDRIDTHVQRAINDPEAAIYVFGEPWGPERSRDKLFGFEPSRGIHEVHMNQGNVEKYLDNDGVWQDGGLLLHFPAAADQEGAVWRAEQWVAVFLAFQSQCWHTDDHTGRRLDPDRDANPWPPRV